MINSKTTTTNKLTQSLSTIPRSQLDTQTCSLLGPFSILIQGILALTILTSLLYKRHREKPKRKFHIWAADVSKQVIGQAFVHMLNIFISDSMASLPSKGNPCALYFMNIFIDTTIGVFVLFLALNSITKLISKILRKSPANLGLSSGHYPRPFLTSWAKQLSIYFIGLLILKLFVISLFWLGGRALIKFGDGIIEGISHDPKIQILMVVMVGPTVLNVLQFLLIDSFIKHKPNLSPEQIESEDDRRFLNEESDFESDDQNFEDDDDRGNNSTSNRSPNHGDEDRTVRKKEGFQTKHSTRHQRARLSNPTNLDGSLSAVVANVHDPHSYPPRISQPETRERNSSPQFSSDLTSVIQNRRRTQSTIKNILTTPSPSKISPSLSKLPTFFNQQDSEESLILLVNSLNTQQQQHHMNHINHSQLPDDLVQHSIVHINSHPNPCTSPTQLKTGFILNPDSSLHSSPHHLHQLHQSLVESHNQPVY